MSGLGRAHSGREARIGGHETRALRVMLLGFGAASLAIYVGLASLGDLREHLAVYLAAHGALFTIYAGIILAVVRNNARLGVPGDGGDPRATDRPLVESNPAESSTHQASSDAGTSNARGGEWHDVPLTRRVARWFTTPEAEPLDRQEGDRTEVRVTRRVVRWFATPEATVALFALAFRLVLVPVPASLSDDIYRYLWDGRVQAAGINPYVHAPESEDLRPLRNTGWERINHREIPTIYPPVLEGVFLAAEVTGLGEVGLKALLSIVDLAVVLVLVLIFRRTGRHTRDCTSQRQSLSQRQRLSSSPLHAAESQGTSGKWGNRSSMSGLLLAIVYAWNPLVVVEVASSGHADPIGLLFLVLATLFVMNKQGDLTNERRDLMTERSDLSIMCWAASALLRWFPLAFLPIFARKLRWRHVVVGLALTVVGFLPYAGAGRLLFRGLRTYAENWDYNSIVFPAARSILDATVPVEALKEGVTKLKEALHDPEWCQILYRAVWPASLTRLLLAAVLAAAILMIAFRVRETPRALFLAIGWMLVLTPTLHPWYLLWMLPFAALELSWPWILMSGLAPLSYASLRSANGRVPLPVLLLEWGAPAVVALVLWSLRGWTLRWRSFHH